MRNTQQKTSIIKNFIHLFFIITQMCIASTHAGVDYQAQSYTAASAPGVASNSFGFDYLSGTINHQQIDISGTLPYTRMYQGSVRSDMAFAVNYYDKMVTNAGWTDNYDNFIDYQNIGNSTTDFMYRIRLPGELQATFFVWNSLNNTWKRMYSSNPLEKMTSNTGILTKSDLGEYSISKNGNQLTITKYGNIFTTGSTPFTSGSSKYLRITQANYPSSGKKLIFSYDGALNMTNVQDNRGNTLTFTRVFKENSDATSQTSNEKTVITAVSLTAGGTTSTQQVNYEYQAAWNKNLNLDDDVVYKLIKSVSTVGGTKNFIYTQLMTPWTNWFLRTKYDVNSFNEPILNLLKVPILTEIQNKNAVTQSKIIVTQNYNATQSGYTSATATIRAYAPIAGATANDMTASYNDMTGATSLVDYKPNGSTSVSASTSFSITPTQKTVEGVTYQDDSQATLTYASPSNFAIFTVGNQPISSMVNDSYYSRLVSYKTLSGTQIDLEYDGLNRLIKKTEIVVNNSLPSRTTTYEYGALSDGSFNRLMIPTKITAPNLVVTQTINTRGQIVQQTTSSPQSGSSTRTVHYDYYDDSTQPNDGMIKVAYRMRDGEQVGQISTFPDKTEYTYDDWGNLATSKSFVSNMHSGSTTARVSTYFDYNSAGLPAGKTDPDGKATVYTYNAAFQVTNENYANLAGISNTYNDLRQLTSSTDADGMTTNYSHDDLGRVIRITKPAGNYTSYQYYPNGTVKLEQQHSSNGYTFEKINQNLNANGLVSKSWKGGNAAWFSNSYSYDVNGNVTSITDANGVSETWTYDAFNRVKTHTNGNGKVDSSAYDIVNNITSITDPNSNVSTFEYKNTNTLMHDNNSELPIKRYWHDLSENVIKQQYGSRSCFYNEHDQLSRMRFSDCVDETNANVDLNAKTFYGWDELRDRIVNAEDETRGSFNDRGVGTRYEYDDLGRISKKRQINKTPKQWGYPTAEQSVQYNYSTSGRLQGMTYPSGNRIEYQYNSVGRLDNIKLNDNHILCAIDWDGADRLRGWAWGCQDQHRYFIDIDDAGHIFGIKNKIDGNDQFNENYYTDRAGRINRKVIDGNYEITYSYDNNDWLTNECRGANNGNCAIGATYTYDNNGNRLSKTWSGNGSVTIPTNESYGYQKNILSSWIIGGNAVNLALTPYKELLDSRIGNAYYDFAGRRKIENGVPNSTKYTGIWNDYNHKNERTFRGGSYIDRQYVYDESSHLIGEYKPDGSLIVEYIWMGDKPVAAVYPGNKVYWMVTDHQNTPRRLIDRDTKAQVWNWNPDAFGRWDPVGSIEMNLRFPGQYYDEQSKLFYNHNRYYNPELGRYMEPDPIGLEGGLNMFAYAGSNPVMNVDPSGLYGVTINGQYVNGTFDISQPETYKNLTSTYVPAPTSFAHPSGYTDHGSSTNTNTGGAYGSLSDAQLGNSAAMGTLNIGYGGSAALLKGLGLEVGMYVTTGEAGQFKWDIGSYSTFSTSTGIGAGTGLSLAYHKGGLNVFEGREVTVQACAFPSCVGVMHNGSRGITGDANGFGVAPFGGNSKGGIPGSFVVSTGYTNVFSLRRWWNGK